MVCVLVFVICHAACDHLCPCRSFLNNSFFSCKDRALERDRPYQRKKGKPNGQSTIPIILETEPDQEFLGFMLETKPFELIYQGPTNVSQVLSFFSASPPQVLLSGFRSRLPHRGQRGIPRPPGQTRSKEDLVSRMH